MSVYQGKPVEFCHNVQARVLVMLCIARSEGRHGCLHSEKKTRLQKLLRKRFVLGSTFRVLLSMKFGVGGQA